MRNLKIRSFLNSYVHKIFNIYKILIWMWIFERQFSRGGGGYFFTITLSISQKVIVNEIVTFSVCLMLLGALFEIYIAYFANFSTSKCLGGSFARLINAQTCIGIIKRFWTKANLSWVNFILLINDLNVSHSYMSLLEQYLLLGRTHWRGKWTFQSWDFIKENKKVRKKKEKKHALDQETN